MSPEFIVDVSEESFEPEVLAFSTHVPVVMDLWAPWSIPCRVQSPLLAKLANEGQGAFRLARVNVDQQTKLAEQLKVKSVPSLRGFVDGRIVADYTGLLSEVNLRGFIDRLMPEEGDLLLDKASNLFQLGDYPGAEGALKNFLSKRPGHSAASLLMARTLLIQGKADQAHHILAHFPASPQYNDAQVLQPLLNAWLWMEEQTVPADSPLIAVYRNALKLAKKGNFEAALDGLLDIIRKDKNFRDGKVRNVYLAILALLGDENPVVRGYRAELTNALF